MGILGDMIMERYRNQEKQKDTARGLVIDHMQQGGNPLDFMSPAGLNEIFGVDAAGAMINRTKTPEFKEANKAFQARESVVGAIGRHITQGTQGSEAHASFDAGTMDRTMSNEHSITVPPTAEAVRQRFSDLKPEEQALLTQPAIGQLTQQGKQLTETTRHDKAAEGIDRSQIALGNRNATEAERHNPINESQGQQDINLRQSQLNEQKTQNMMDNAFKREGLDMKWSEMDQSLKTAMAGTTTRLYAEGNFKAQDAAKMAAKLHGTGEVDLTGFDQMKPLTAGRQTVDDDLTKAKLKKNNDWLTTGYFDRMNRMQKDRVAGSGATDDSMLKSGVDTANSLFVDALLENGSIFAQRAGQPYDPNTAFDTARQNMRFAVIEPGTIYGTNLGKQLKRWDELSGPQKTDAEVATRQLIEDRAKKMGLMTGAAAPAPKRDVGAIEKSLAEKFKLPEAPKSAH